MKVKAKALTLPLILIIFVGFLFRSINFSQSFFFEHDQDLYSWIAKDILVNHHQRLVGQITSVDGVFIGSFYYYLMAFFYALLKMDPLSAMIPLSVLGMFNIWSIFYIFRKHFGAKTGYIGAFIYATSLGIAFFDRWSVPTLPTLAWAIWFVDVILELGKGNLRYLPLYGFLCGFTWQVHIALLPILPIPIIAYLINKNEVKRLWEAKNIKVVVVAVGVFLLTLSPFLAFEVKHNFSQIKSMATGINKDAGGPTGFLKLKKVFDASGKELQVRMLYGFETKYVDIFWVALAVFVFFSIKSKKISNQQLVAFGLWYFLILLAQFTSKRIVSEYYFTNLLPIYLLFTSLFLSQIFTSINLLYVLGAVFLGINGLWLFTKTDYDQSYLNHMEIVERVKNDAIKNKYPCIAVNFIADPGVGVGFRYLFWYKGVKLVRPGTPGVPVYNVAIPWQISASEEDSRFGRFGLVMPIPVEIKPENCNKAESQLDPLLGYVQ